MGKVYDEYLKSERWQKKKALLLGDNPKCRICHVETRLHIHHRTYRYLGNETEYDTFILCKTCHKRVHRKADKENISLMDAYHILYWNKNRMLVYNYKRPKQPFSCAKRYSKDL